jgi:hypothetical protein
LDTYQVKVRLHAKPAPLSLNTHKCSAVLPWTLTALC